MARRILAVVAAALLVGPLVQAADLNFKITADGNLLKIEMPEWSAKAKTILYDEASGQLTLEGTRNDRVLFLFAKPTPKNPQNWERSFPFVLAPPFMVQAASPTTVNVVFNDAKSVIVHLKGTKKDPTPKTTTVPFTDADKWVGPPPVAATYVPGPPIPPGPNDPKGTRVIPKD